MRNPIMVGRQVYLRALEPDDARAIAEGSAAETETMMLRGRWPISPIAAERWITDLYKPALPKEFEFAVCRIADDLVIGMVGLEGIDYINRTAETGSWLLRSEHRGRGYGTEAKHLLLEFAFDRIHLHVLFSVVWAPNRRSAAALVKQGYRPSGRIKWGELKNGVFEDHLYFDLTREDWLAARERWRAEQDARAP